MAKQLKRIACLFMFVLLCEGVKEETEQTLMNEHVAEGQLMNVNDDVRLANGTTQMRTQDWKESTDLAIQELNRKLKARQDLVAARGFSKDNRINIPLLIGPGSSEHIVKGPAYANLVNFPTEGDGTCLLHSIFGDEVRVVRTSKVVAFNQKKSTSEDIGLRKKVFQALTSDINSSTLAAKMWGLRPLEAHGEAGAKLWKAKLEDETELTPEDWKLILASKAVTEYNAGGLTKEGYIGVIHPLGADFAWLHGDLLPCIAAALGFKFAMVVNPIGSSIITNHPLPDVVMTSSEDVVVVVDRGGHFEAGLLYCNGTW